MKYEYEYIKGFLDILHILSRSGNVIISILTRSEH